MPLCLHAPDEGDTVVLLVDLQLFQNAPAAASGGGGGGAGHALPGEVVLQQVGSISRERRVFLILTSPIYGTV